MLQLFCSVLSKTTLSFVFVNSL
uniref:Uncharacterized protein n=1 Tax=Anguilla anguilla TaxID=7936 RepID=A0A0E9XLF4_ANGAN